MLKVKDFKKHVQQLIEGELGERVNREKAWLIYKKLFWGTVKYLLDQIPNSSVGQQSASASSKDVANNKLAIPGIGTFELGISPPKFKYSPSKVIITAIKKRSGSNVTIKNSHARKVFR